MTRRSQAQEDSVRKAARTSGERRRLAAEQRQRAAVARAARGVAPGVEVVGMRAGAPCLVGAYYVVNATGSEIISGPYDDPSDAAENRKPGEHVARESA